MLARSSRPLDFPGPIALHTDIPSRRQIERLLQERGGPLVSIYLPTTPITPEAEADRAAGVIRAVMESASEPAVALTVPLVVDARWAKNWDEAH